MKCCLIAPNIYPILTGDYSQRKIGGAELQQLNIARSLLARGHDVRIICLDHGQPDAQNVGGIIVLKTFREDSGIPGIRFFYPRLSSLWAALRRANSDLYYCRTAQFTLGILRFFRMFTGKRYVFAGALDTDFVPGLASIPTLRDRLLYEFGLRGANGIFVQSETQRELLRKHYGLRGTVVQNFLLDPRKKLPVEDRRIVLWVSTIRNRKRPSLFVRLAKQFPSERFVMVGGGLESHESLYEDVCAASRDIANLEFLGFQPYEKVEALFDKCKVFVNTSMYEGFPNTYLQAWRREIPVVSFVDPDNVIVKNALGRVVKTEEQLPEALAVLLHSYRKYRNAGDYYVTHHSAAIGEQLGGLLEQVVA